MSNRPPQIGVGVVECAPAATDEQCQQRGRPAVVSRLPSDDDLDRVQASDVLTRGVVFAQPRSGGCHVARSTSTIMQTSRNRDGPSGRLRPLVTKLNVKVRVAYRSNSGRPPRHRPDGTTAQAPAAHHRQAWLLMQPAASAEPRPQQRQHSLSGRLVRDPQRQLPSVRSVGTSSGPPAAATRSPQPQMPATPRARDRGPRRSCMPQSAGPTGRTATRTALCRQRVRRDRRPRGGEP